MKDSLLGLFLKHWYKDINIIFMRKETDGVASQQWLS